MTSSCNWLPVLVLLEQYGRNWETYVEAVYRYLKNDFIDSRPDFDNKKVGLRREPLYRNKEFGFWHCTSEGETEAERTPDIRRCERIRWPRPIIEHFNDKSVRCWRNKRGSDKRVVFWFYDENYVVILAERNSYYLLWTTYLIKYKHAEEKLMKEYEEYQKRLMPPF
jgi:hypothetical protein